MRVKALASALNVRIFRLGSVARFATLGPFVRLATGSLAVGLWYVGSVCLRTYRISCWRHSLLDYLRGYSGHLEPGVLLDSVLMVHNLRVRSAPLLGELHF